MMRGSTYLHLYLIFLFSCAFILAAKSLPSSSQPQCHEDERSALLLFRNSFSTYRDWVDVAPRGVGWNNDTNHNCCTWDGVKCDEETGHVVGLDLTCLNGTLSATNNLFRLVHLRSLSLTFSDFQRSKIPREIGHLHDLRSLNLSYSNFWGQIPREITMLSKLSMLDLSWNNELLLHSPSLKDVALNLTSLRELHLYGVDISSTIPSALTNLSSLKSLSLSDTGLNGTFPSSIFQLPYLEHLDLSDNFNLRGSLPEFPLKVPLKELSLSKTGFSGKLPPSIENLWSLSTLDLSSSNFEGLIPSSLGHLTRLTYLDLRCNNFEGRIPFSLGHLTRLTYLDLHQICSDESPIPFSFNQSSRLVGNIPSSFSNLTRLKYLDLSGNNINIQSSSPYSWHWLSKLTALTNLFISGLTNTGYLPPSIANLTKLQKFDASNNELIGPIPSWLMNLTHLEAINLGHNKRLTANFNTFLNCKNLNALCLDGFESILFSRQNDTNQASQVIHVSNILKSRLSDPKQAYPKFGFLSLNNCSLTEIPQFLKHQDDLEILRLANNKIHGKIPQWLLNTSKYLEKLYLSHNFFTGFENPGQASHANFLQVLDLSNNKLQGSFPSISFPDIQNLYVSHNLLTGEIPTSICNFTSLDFLDLSNNNFTGKIPLCIVSNYMIFLSLNGNNLHGSIPQSFKRSCHLEQLDLSQNQLEGELPRSLVNCRDLVSLKVGRNRINDTFPSWLGNLPSLQVLILEYNNFYGTIKAPKSNQEFPSLRIISLSHNSHTGFLPTKYIQNWHAMKTLDHDQSLTYMRPLVLLSHYKLEDSSPFFTVIITNKGNDLMYLRIPNGLKVIDLSSNNFRGEIPNGIGNLRGLKVLNFSNNDLTGTIPSSLANITGLESLDLSHNQLLGKIPEGLVQLNFLEIFNVSYNHMEGPIPQGNQFGALDNSSFIGNQLCGDPLTKRCGDVDSPSSTQDETYEDSVLMVWIIRLLGYGSGFIVGFVIGKIVISDMHCKRLV